MLALSFNSFAQEHDHSEHDGHAHTKAEAPQEGHAAHSKKAVNQKELDSLLNKFKVSEKHAAQFGRLIIQDAGGRMKPINTFSSELLRKVSHSDTYKEMNSDQAFLSMTQYASVWIEIPLIYIKSGNDSIRKIIGIDKDAKYAPFVAFFDEKGNYKLSPFLDEAYKAAIPNKFQSDFIDCVACTIPVRDGTKVNTVIGIGTTLHKFTDTKGSPVGAALEKSLTKKYFQTHFFLTAIL